VSSDFYMTSIVPFAPIMWFVPEAVGIPYTGGIIWALLMALVVVGRLYIHKFEPPPKSLDSYQYLKAFSSCLKDRMTRAKRVQRHFYAVFGLAVMFGAVASTGGQVVIGKLVEAYSGRRRIDGVPLVLIVAVIVVTVAIELLGGVIFDWDISVVYRPVFRKLEQMVAEMEDLRSWRNGQAVLPAT
jgi:hypothetical protein